MLGIMKCPFIAPLPGGGSLWNDDSYNIVGSCQMSVGPEAIPGSFDHHSNIYEHKVYTTHWLDYFQVVFFGIMLGAPSWGLMADKCGRKKVSVLHCYCSIHTYLLYGHCTCTCLVLSGCILRILFALNQLTLMIQYVSNFNDFTMNNH